MELRPYQVKAKQEVINAFDDHQGVFLMLPTGGGKTAIFSSLTKDWVEQGKNVCILAHREELITQGASTIERITGIKAGVILAGDSTRPWSPIQVCSIDSMRRRTLPVTPDYIIIDEAHLINSKRYVNFLKKYPNSKRLLVSATPKRLDKKGFTEFASHMVIGSTINQLIDLGYLVKPKVYTGSDLGGSLAGVAKKMGEYSSSQLGELMSGTKIMGDIVGQYQEKAPGRKGVVFCPTVEHSKQVAKAFNDMGIKAEHIDGTTPSTERKDILARLKNGETTIVTNVAILCEGWDEPSIGYVGLARPTKSLALYIQQAGRGLRTHENKPDCIIIDHGNNIDEHGHLLAEKKWDLHGSTAKDKILKTHRECPKCGGWSRIGRLNCEVCGHEFPRQQRVVNTMLSTMKLTTVEDARLRKIRMEYIGYLDKAGKLSEARLKEGGLPVKSGMAYFKMVDKYGKEDFSKAVPYKEGLRLVKEVYEPYLQVKEAPKKDTDWLMGVVDKALAK
jgi:superfamily II DNA or RNA helicase